MLIEVVGRPRIPTNTSQGYVVAILVVLVVIVIVPYRLVQLAEALRRQSMYVASAAATQQQHSRPTHYPSLSPLPLSGTRARYIRRAARTRM